MTPRPHDIRTLLFLLILLTGLTCMAFPTKEAKAAPTQAAVCWEIKPGIGIGAVSLGMGMKAIKALQKKHKYTLKREGDGPVYHLGPYRILLKGKGNARKVGFVDMSFKGKKNCFRLGKKIVRPKGSWLSLAAKLGVCGPVEMRIGGNVIRCASKGMMLITSRAPGYRVFVEKGLPVTSSQPICAGYIARGGGLYSATESNQAKWNKPATLKLKAGKRYCFGRLMVTTKTRPKQIPTMGQCEIYNRRGARIVFCNHAGLAFVFGGPHAVLDHIDAYHYSVLPLPTKYPPPLPKTKPRRRRR